MINNIRFSHHNVRIFHHINDLVLFVFFPISLGCFFSASFGYLPLYNQLGNYLEVCDITSQNNWLCLKLSHQN